MSGGGGGGGPSLSDMQNDLMGRIAGDKTLSQRTKDELLRRNSEYATSLAGSYAARDEANKFVSLNDPGDGSKRLETRNAAKAAEQGLYANIQETNKLLESAKESLASGTGGEFARVLREKNVKSAAETPGRRQTIMTGRM